MVGSVATCQGAAMLRFSPSLRSCRAFARASALVVWLAVGGAGLGPFAATPAAAQARVCLDGSAAQAAVFAGQARRLSELRGAIDGELIRADLCRDGDRFVYVVTTLGASGKVSRRLVDADPATLLPGRPPVAAPMLAVPVRPPVAAPMLAVPVRPPGLIGSPGDSY
jgi:hypothetical protein